MAWDLRGNMDDEIDRVLGCRVDHSPRRGRPSSTRPTPTTRHPPIVSSGAVVDGVFDQNATGHGDPRPARPAYSQDVVDGPRRACARGVAAMPELLGPRRRHRLATRWVVDGDHTATGKPLLANDPHLGVEPCRASGADGPALPTVVGRAARSTSPASRSPGVPGVVIGHNADIAWGFTNLGPDVTDLYLEQVERRRPYLYDGECAPLTTRDGDDQGRAARTTSTLTVRETAHGR